MVPVLLQELDDLPRHGAVVPGRVRVTGEAEMYALACDPFPFELPSGLFDDIWARSDVGMEFFPVTMHNVRNVTVEALVRTACVNIQCKLSVLMRCPLSFIYRFH